MVIKTTSEHRVVTAILRRGQRVLLCHRRPARRWYPDAWDLPGGHVEDGELPRQALMREMREELGIRITAPAEPIAHVQGPDLRMEVWLVDTWTGNPVNLAPDEHDDLGWFDLGQTSQLHLAHPRLLDLLTSVLDQPARTAGPGASNP